MIDCAGLRPLLSFYLEKEAGPLDSLEARRHLDSCAPCRERARRLAGAMARCDALQELSPTQDIARVVMNRLSALKRTSLQATPAMAAKWTGLALMLAAGLGAIFAPSAPVARLLSRPVTFLAGLVAGGEGERLRDLIGGALPLIPSAMSGGVGPELAPATAMDMALAVQLLGTALVFGLGMAIPVALLTAWLLHRESAS